MAQNVSAVPPYFRTVLHNRAALSKTCITAGTRPGLLIFCQAKHFLPAEAFRLAAREWFSHTLMPETFQPCHKTWQRVSSLLTQNAATRLRQSFYI